MPADGNNSPQCLHPTCQWKLLSGRFTSRTDRWEKPEESTHQIFWRIKFFINASRGKLENSLCLELPGKSPLEVSQTLGFYASSCFKGRKLDNTKTFPGNTRKTPPFPPYRSQGPSVSGCTACTLDSFWAPGAGRVAGSKCPAPPCAPCLWAAGGEAGTIYSGSCSGCFVFNILHKMKTYWLTW